MVRLRCLWMFPSLALFVATSAPGAEPAERRAYGMIFCHAEMKEPKAFLQTTPCVTGGNWRCTKEDDKFWYGDLHYPTENTADYDRGDSDGAPLYYMVMNLAVKKQEGLPIDLKKFEGALVLRDSAPDKPLAMRGDGTSYELVGYEDKSRDDRAYNFLFANNQELKFTPQKKSEK